MMMILVVDANILVGELLRQRGQELIQDRDLTIYATERVMEETRYELRRRVTIMVNQGRASEIEAEALLSSAQEILETDVMLIPDWFYRHPSAEALDRIPRDPEDWPTVALALALGAAIWTQDYDFFGCGCPVWTTETLLIQMRRRSGG